MVGLRSSHKFEQTSKLTVKILNMLYVGGAYGLILVSVVQVMILISWIRH